MARNSVPFAAALIAGCILHAGPAAAVDGQVLITQAKALNGSVTPGDTAGFPVTLSVSGSYKLASNLIPGPGKDGIVVTASDVTIDLNGFVLSGGPAGGSKNSLDGIVDKSDRLTVRNGTIGAFASNGIDATGRYYLIVQDIRLVNNYNGISAGSFARILNDTVATNSGTGIDCGNSCQVEGSLVSSNLSYGIIIEGGTVLGNTIMNNTGFGIYASGSIVGYGNNTITGNTTQVSGVTALTPNACSPAC